MSSEVLVSQVLNPGWIRPGLLYPARNDFLTRAWMSMAERDPAGALRAVRGRGARAGSACLRIGDMALVIANDALTKGEKAGWMALGVAGDAYRKAQRVFRTYPEVEVWGRVCA